jgi:NADPH:quinone reductase-like Zn-dependent oxidoreductase
MKIQPTLDERTTADTMQAVVQRSYGSVDTLTYTEIARPDVGAGQVLVEVHAAGVDRGVWHLMTGTPYLVRLAGYGITKPKQQVPGLDVSGTVVAVGNDVTRFAVGDEVFGIAGGAYAEYAVAEEKKLAHKPSNITFDQAAVTAISGITALQALVDEGRIAAGQKVLVIGASGGVGSYVVQLAKASGAMVTGVASEAKTDFVRSLGADQVIDYRKNDYLDGSVNYDLIIDTGGRNSVRRLGRALRRKGTLVIVGGEDGNKLTGGIGRQIWAKVLSLFVSQRLTFFISEEHHSHMDRLAAYLDRGAVVPPVGRRYTLDSVGEAITDLVTGKAEGKSVIVVRKDKNQA